MKLNAYLARSGLCSRRKAALLVKEGRVALNGKIVLEPWLEVTELDRVVADKKAVTNEKNIYIVFNKPKGITVTLEDPFASRKIIDFIPKGMGRVYPVGRLDRLSRGLIILTNDGELCYQLTHPKFETEKEYFVIVKGTVDDKLLHRLRKGIKEGPDILKVKSAFIERSASDKATIKVVVCEGKKRHLRRLFRALGLDVLDIRRVRIGNLNLGGLREGEFKVVDKKTIYALTNSKKRAEFAY